jgi:hypothetical protein
MDVPEVPAAYDSLAQAADIIPPWSAGTPRLGSLFLVRPILGGDGDTSLTGLCHRSQQQ